MAAVRAARVSAGAGDAAGVWANAAAVRANARAEIAAGSLRAIPSFSMAAVIAEPLQALYPAGVGVEEQEKDEGDDENVGVEEEHDAAVVETPARAEAARGFPGAVEGDERGQNDPRRGMDVGEAGAEAGKDQA